MRKLVAKVIDDRLRRWVGRGHGGRFGERGAGDGEVALSGDADFAANQPGDVGGDRDLLRGGAEIRSDMHGDGEDDFVLVAEVHEGAEGQAPRGRELERIGSNACGEMPLRLRRLAGVAGVDPIHVPAGLHLEIEAGGERLTRVDLGGWNEEGDGEVRRSDRRGRCRGRACGQRSDEEREEQDPMGTRAHAETFCFLL